MSAIVVPSFNKDSRIESVAARSFASIDPDAKIWLQLTGEPQNHYFRFQIYLMLGEDRTVLDAYNRYRAQSQGLPSVMKVPPDWKKIAAVWRWRDRAQAFDRMEAKRRMKEYEEERALDRKARIEFAKSFKSKVQQALEAYDPAEHGVSLSELTSAFRALGGELRAEWDDEPTQKQEITITSMADLIRAARQEREQAQGNIIDADFR